MSVVICFSVYVRFDIELLNIDFNDEISFLSSKTPSIKYDFIAIKFVSTALNLAREFGRFGVRCKEAEGVVSKLSID